MCDALQTSTVRESVRACGWLGSNRSIGKPLKHPKIICNSRLGYNLSWFIVVESRVYSIREYSGNIYVSTPVYFSIE